MDCYAAPFFAFANEPHRFTPANQFRNPTCESPTKLCKHTINKKKGYRQLSSCPPPPAQVVANKLLPRLPPPKNPVSLMLLSRVAAAAESDSSQYVAMMQVLSKENGPKQGTVCKGKCYTMLLIAVLLVFLTPFISIIACYKQVEVQLTAFQTNCKFMHDQMKTMSSELNKNQLHLAKEKAQSALFFEEAESVGRDYGKLLLEFDEQAAEKSILEAKLAATENADKANDKANKLQAIVLKFQLDLAEVLKSPPNVKTIFPPGSPGAKYVAKFRLSNSQAAAPRLFLLKDRKSRSLTMQVR